MLYIKKNHSSHIAPASTSWNRPPVEVHRLHSGSTKRQFVTLPLLATDLNEAGERADGADCAAVFLTGYLAVQHRRCPSTDSHSE
jgi:hypothetical protein